MLLAQFKDIIFGKKVSVVEVTPPCTRSPSDASSNPPRNHSQQVHGEKHTVEEGKIGKEDDFDDEDDEPLSGREQAIFLAKPPAGSAPLSASSSASSPPSSPTAAAATNSEMLLTNSRPPAPRKVSFGTVTMVAHDSDVQ